MKLGVLKELSSDRRVAMLPDAVEELLKKYQVEFLIERNAGNDVFISDDHYYEKGAKTVGREEIFSDADIIIAIGDPREDEIEKMNEGQVLVSVFYPLNNRSYVERLQEKKITSFSLDNIPRLTRSQSMDVLSSQATVAGYKAVLEAANHIQEFFPMFMTAAGIIKPAKVLVLGAGVAGLQAIATAKRLGAVVSAFDVRAAVKEQVNSLGAGFIEVDGAKEEIEAGGYAIEQTEEFKKKQMELIHEHALKSDVIIATAQIPGKKAPVLIKEETVNSMKSGSVIIDLAASTGGNCELTKNNETIKVNNVTVIGQSNLPAQVPLSASYMYGKNVINFLKLIINEENKLSLRFEDDVVIGTCITHQGEIVSERIKKAYDNN